MKKWLKIVLGVTAVLIFSSVGSYYFGSKFHSSECVEDAGGYIWHINRYSFGEYQLMGWQKPWWGNEVSMKRNILERKDISGVPVYHQITCPTLDS